MNLKDILTDSSKIDGDLVLYAKKINGQLLPMSEAVLLELNEEEMEMKTTEIANSKCPGFSYCMEMFLIQEFVKDLDSLPQKMDIDSKVDRVIYYIENDA